MGALLSFHPRHPRLHPPRSIFDHGLRGFHRCRLRRPAERGLPGRSALATRLVPKKFRNVPNVRSCCAQDGRAPLFPSVSSAATSSAFSFRPRIARISQMSVAPPSGARPSRPQRFGSEVGLENFATFRMCEAAAPRMGALPSFHPSHPRHPRLDPPAKLRCGRQRPTGVGLLLHFPVPGYRDN